MLAMFVALTGTAVATTSGLITGKQIKNSSITGADVKNKSLTPKDFKGSVRGPRGLTGATGAKGGKGDKGDRGAKGDKGDPGTPAPADGADVQMGRVVHPGGAPACLTGSATGLSLTGALRYSARRG